MARMKNFREVQRILLQNGWVLKNTTGSHFQYVHPDKAQKITIPRHSGDLDPVTVRTILKQAGLL